MGGGTGEAQLTFAPGYLLDNEEVDTALLRQAAQTAKDADVAVVFIGLTDRMESEAMIASISTYQTRIMSW